MIFKVIALSNSFTTLISGILGEKVKNSPKYCSIPTFRPNNTLASVLEGYYGVLENGRIGFSGQAIETRYQDNAEKKISSVVKGNYGHIGNGKTGFFGYVSEDIYQADGKNISSVIEGSCDDIGNGERGFVGHIIETHYKDNVRTYARFGKSGDIGNGKRGFVGIIKHIQYQAGGNTVLYELEGPIGEIGNGKRDLFDYLTRRNIYRKKGQKTVLEVPWKFCRQTGWVIAGPGKLTTSYDTGKSIVKEGTLEVGGTAFKVVTKETYYGINGKKEFEIIPDDHTWGCREIVFS